MNNIKWKTLNELTLNITDGTHDSIKDDPEGECFLLSSKNIKNGLVCLDEKERKINQKTLNKLKRRTCLEEGDILLTTVGTIGEVALKKDGRTDYDFQRSVAIIKPNTNMVSSRYLYYILKTDVLKSQYEKYSTGSVQKCLFLGNISNLKIPYIDTPKQEKIANLLSSLDNKIEINNKINEQLEELGQLLYTKWFVNFDFPNEEGKPYRSSGGEMIESELGMIPKGWKIFNLDELASIVTGKQNANIKNDAGKYEFFTCSRESLKANQYSFDTKAILVAGNGEFYVQWYEGKFEAYQRTYVIEPNIVNMFFPIYLTIKNKMQYITQDSRGSIIKFITIGHLNSIRIALPEALNLDISNLDSIYAKIHQNNIENKKLEELRDFLIPQLMSGNLEIKDIEELEEKLK